jgi:hypothetical protein
MIIATSIIGILLLAHLQCADQPCAVAGSPQGKQNKRNAPVLESCSLEAKPAALRALTLPAAQKGNSRPSPFVYSIVKLRRWLAASLPLACLLASTPSDYQSAQRKIDGIGSDRLKPGARVELTAAELDAYAEHYLPEGVRNPKVEITAPEMATGSALVDFAKLGRAEGHPPGWLLSFLLNGERPVSVTARIRSSGGQATVDVRSVQVGGVQIDGAALDFLIRNVLLTLYPDAVVGRPFALGHRIASLDVQPRAVRILIGR